MAIPDSRLEIAEVFGNEYNRTETIMRMRIAHRSIPRRREVDEIPFMDRIQEVVDAIAYDTDVSVEQVRGGNSPIASVKLHERDFEVLNALNTFIKTPVCYPKCELDTFTQAGEDDVFIDVLVTYTY